MSSSVEKAVLNQFAQAVASVATCPVDVCKFVHVRSLGHVMHVTYEWKDACCRCQSADAYIDVKDICFEDLCDRAWINYIQSLAVSFEKAICIRPLPPCQPPKLACLEQPKWHAYPCTVTRVIDLPPVVCKPKCVTVTKVVSRTCECVAMCPACPYGAAEVSYTPDLCCEDRKPDCHQCPSKKAPAQEWYPSFAPHASRQQVSCGCK